MKLRKGDEVVVLVRQGHRQARHHHARVAGTRQGDRHRRPPVINVVKRHQKPRGATMQGGIIDKEMPIHVSNVALWCNKCGATRIGYRIDDDGKKTRICRSLRG